MKLLFALVAIAIIVVITVVFSLITKGNQNREEDFGPSRNMDEKSLHLLELLQKFYANNPGFTKMYFEKLNEYIKSNYNLDYYADYVIAKIGDTPEIFAITTQAQKVVGGKIYSYKDFKDLTYNSIAIYG